MRKALFALALLLIGGCIPSLNAVYQPKDLVFDPHLVGRWGQSNAQDSWTFAKLNAKSYRLTYTDKQGVKGHFKAHLAKIDDLTLLDLQPEKEDAGGNDFYKAYLLPLHTFFRVERLDADRLELTSIDHNWLKRHLNETPDAIAHQMVDGTVLITASASELQAFLLAHRQTAEAFTEPLKMTRR